MKILAFIVLALAALSISASAAGVGASVTVTESTGGGSTGGGGGGGGEIVLPPAITAQSEPAPEIPEASTPLIPARVFSSPTPIAPSPTPEPTIIPSPSPTPPSPITGLITGSSGNPFMLLLLLLALLAAYFLHMAGGKRGALKHQQRYNFFALMAIAIPFVLYAATRDMNLSLAAGALEDLLAYAFWRRADGMAKRGK